MRVEYHPKTASELNSAISYHNQQRPGLGDELRQEVYAAIEQARAAPYRHPVIFRDIRRVLVHRFPYAVLFRLVDGDTLRVLVIRHHRRQPRFGTTRR